MTSSSSIKVMFYCTGVGIYNRGIETFFREAFDGLYPLLPSHGVSAVFYKGGGPDVPPAEHRIWCLPRTGPTASFIGRLIRRNSYVVEQLTFLPGLVRAIKREKPDVVYYSDANVAMRLQAWRGRRFGLPANYKLVYSNGAPMHPPFDGVDHVQQVAPHFYEESIRYGEPANKHSLVPYGIQVPKGDPDVSTEFKRKAREELGLPLNRQILISVGAIGTKTHKRMPYTISEVAKLPSETRPYLLLLGAMEPGAAQVEQQMLDQLGKGHFAMKSVSPNVVRRYYQASDAFCLGSLSEGFGRVFLEALIEGLPCVVHDHPVMRYVLADVGAYANLNESGTMASKLTEVLRCTTTPSDAADRRESVRRRFSWDALAPQYAEMFHRAASLS